MISKILKEKREAQGLKVREVALYVGVAESTYRDWENGRSIQGEPYLKLSEILEMPLISLLGGQLCSKKMQVLKDLEEVEKRVKNIRLDVNQILNHDS